MNAYDIREYDPQNSQKTPYLEKRSCERLINGANICMLNNISLKPLDQLYKVIKIPSSDWLEWVEGVQTEIRHSTYY